MVQIVLPFELVERVAGALRSAGRREVGGMLMGENLGGGRFRVADLSVQMSGGGAACFLRDPQHHADFTRAFFEKAGSDYTRFNYLGEWHSHPNHLPLPSETDHRSMQQIVEGDDSNPLFAVMMIFRRDRREVTVSGTVYRREMAPDAIDLVIEGDAGTGTSLMTRLRRKAARFFGGGEEAREMKGRQ